MLIVCRNLFDMLQKRSISSFIVIVYDKTSDHKVSGVSILRIFPKCFICSNQHNLFVESIWTFSFCHFIYLKSVKIQLCSPAAFSDSLLLHHCLYPDQSNQSLYLLSPPNRCVNSQDLALASRCRSTSVAPAAHSGQARGVIQVI